MSTDGVTYQGVLSSETNENNVVKHQCKASTFDADGNLNRLGMIHLCYLKAKCLQKLKRYSECLFQLAKIEQMSDTSNLLPEN